MQRLVDEVPAPQFRYSFGQREGLRAEGDRGGSTLRVLRGKDLL